MDEESSDVKFSREFDATTQISTNFSSANEPSVKSDFWQDCYDYVVYQLGVVDQLPLLYHYREGILELRSRLFNRYGESKLDEAMEIVYDLIEDRDAASGWGDAGDVWAAWRDEHKRQGKTPNNIRSTDRRFNLDEHYSFDALPGNDDFIHPTEDSVEAPSIGFYRMEGESSGADLRNLENIETSHASERDFSTKEVDFGIAATKGIDTRGASVAQAVDRRDLTLEPDESNLDWTKGNHPRPVSGGFSERRPSTLLHRLSVTSSVGRRVSHPKTQIRSSEQTQDRFRDSSFLKFSSRIRNMFSNVTNQQKQIGSNRPTSMPTMSYQTRESLANEAQFEKSDAQEKSTVFPTFCAEYVTCCWTFERQGRFTLPETNGKGSLRVVAVGDEFRIGNNAVHCFQYTPQQNCCLSSHTTDSLLQYYCKLLCSSRLLFVNSSFSHNQLSLSYTLRSSDTDNLEQIKEDIVAILCSSDTMEADKVSMVEPTKFNPSAPEKKWKEDIEAWSKMVPNPLDGAGASYRDTLATKEQYFPPIPDPSKNQGFQQPGKRSQWTTIEAEKIPPTLHCDSNPGDEAAFRYAPSNEQGTTVTSLHRRNESLPQQKLTDPFVFENKSSNNVPKSISEGNLFGNFSTNASWESSPRRRKKAPAPITTFRNSPSKAKLDRIDEQNDVKNYKVVVKTGDGEDSKVAISPLKKLFGEGGLLGRSTSAKELPDPRYKKSALAHWGGKFKQQVETLGREISEKLPTLDQTARRPSDSAGPSTFPISLPPLHQGEFYMKLELLLNNETNRYIMSQLERGRISVESVKRVVETWANKGRPQVVGFRYDLATQRDLILYNIETVRFHGVAGIYRVQVNSILTAWKVLAKEISVRTFCQPDSAVRKHLHDAERILELIDAAPESMGTLQEMRAHTLWEIYCVRKAEREKDNMHGVERVWSPSRFEHDDEDEEI